MEINEKKLERQKLGINHWRYSKSRGAPRNGCGTLNWYTGVGKTYAAILIIQEVLAKDNAAKVIILVPTDNLLRDWRMNIKTFIDEKLVRNVKVYTAQYLTLNDSIVLECTLLVIDELDTFYADERINLINGKRIRYKHNLGLTATFTDQTNRQNKIIELFPIIDTIDEAEALREGYISNFIEYNLGVELNSLERAEYDEVSERVLQFIAKFGKFGFPAASLCLTGKDKYSGFQYAMMWAIKNGWRNNLDMTNEKEKEIDDLWNPSKIIGYARNLMNATRDRLDLIYRTEAKYQANIEILQRFPNLKAICFSQSTAFADKLSLLINDTYNSNISVVYHSKLTSQPLKDENGNYYKYKSGAKKDEVKLFGKKFLREYAINAIKTGKALYLITAQSMDKGADFPDIMIGITSSGSRNPTQYSQRGGRVKRLKDVNVQGKKLIINVYTKDTKEEFSLRSRQRKGTNTIHWATNVSDIHFSPEVEPVISDSNLFNENCPND